MAEAKKQFRLILKDTEGRAVFIELKELSKMTQYADELAAMYKELLKIEKEEQGNQAKLK